jgi:hypothetical protein
MWQVLLGIYIVVIILSAVILWSTLVLAKKSDNGFQNRPRINRNLAPGAKNAMRAERASGLLAIKLFSKK